MADKQPYVTAQSQVIDQTGRRSVAHARRGLVRDMVGKLTAAAPDGGSPIVLRIDADLGGFDRWRVDADASGIVITGSDELGCVHGVYDFAERFLDADPMQWVTRITPPLTDRVEVPVGTWASPLRTFRHRGFFFNDEDLLVGFQRKEVRDGFNTEVWERLFETLLRLGGTCVIPGTNIFSDERQVRLASEMGLYTAQHHAEPVGCPTYHCWPRQLPYSLNEHEDVFVLNWRRAIERQAGEKVIWTLGFRGFLDGAFWHNDPTLGPDASDEQKAAVINRAVALQHRLVLEHRHDDDHAFVFYCRGEMFPLLEGGLLELPPGTTLLLTPDQLDADAVSRDSPTGVYAWANFFNRMSDMRIMSRSPVEIGRTMEAAVQHGRTDMLLLNVGNLREKGFHIRQYMNLARDHEGWRESAGGDAWFATYARDVLGTDSPDVQDVYRRLVGIRNALIERGDEAYFTLVEIMLRELYTHGSGAEAMILKRIPGPTMREKARALADAFDKSASEWEVAWHRARTVEARVDPAARLFFQQEALAQTEKMHHLDATIHDFAASIVSYFEQRYQDARNQSWQAVRHVGDALDLERRIDTDRFQGWHRNDTNCRTWKIRDLLTTWHRMLDDLRFVSLPFQSRNTKLVYRHQYQPGFDSEYRGRGELILDHDPGLPHEEDRR